MFILFRLLGGFILLILLITKHSKLLIKKIYLATFINVPKFIRMKNIQIFLFLLFGSSLFYACQKDQVFDTPLSQNVVKTKSKTILIDGSENQAKSGNPDEIVLGGVLPNPYSHNNVLAAFNAIYPTQQRTSLTITHQYMRFLPSDWDAVEALVTAFDVFQVTNQENDIEEHDPYLFNYPIHREVLQEGIYYHDPSLPTNSPSYYYAVVEPGFQVPAGVASKVLDNLVHVPYNTYIIAEAFRLAGATYYGVDGQPMISCEPGCPNYPQCYDPTVSCSGGGVQGLPIPCESSIAWHHCNQIFIPAPQYPTGATNTSSCGCFMSDDPDKPGGCVQVDDTQFGREGVSSIKIYVKDLYFFGRETWTNSEGCWLIDHKYFGGIHPFVDWVNNLVEFRAMRGIATNQLGHRLKQDCGTHGGGVYHDFQIYHPSFGDNASIRRTHWAASTVLNAYYDFNALAYTEGIVSLNGANRLRIWMLNGTGGAAAPMLYDIDANTSNLNALQVIVPLIASFSAPPLGFTSWSTAANVPDLIYNYGNEGLRSDALKHLCFHEYAHLAHYRGLPSSDRYSYWWDNITRTVNNQLTNDNSPYGSPTTTGAEKTAIIEAWGNHIGGIFADMHYGIDCSLSRDASTPNEKQKARFIYRPGGLEQYNPNSSSLNAWIPEGVFWDLMDDKAHNLAPLSVLDPITDNVQGVTNTQVFSAITQGAPTTIVAVRDAIKVNSGVNAGQIDFLFLMYGY